MFKQSRKTVNERDAHFKRAFGPPLQRQTKTHTDREKGEKHQLERKSETKIERENIEKENN